MKTIYQFGSKNVSCLAPRIKDLPAVDCRSMTNPFVRGVPDDELRQRVRSNPAFETLVQYGVSLLAEHDSICVFCLYGKHRSVAVAEEVAKRTGAEIKHLT